MKKIFVLFLFFFFLPFVPATTTEAHGYNLNQISAVSDQTGMKITMRENAKVLVSVTKSSNDNSDTAYLFVPPASTNCGIANAIASASFSGDTATFNYLLSANSSYYVTGRKSAAVDHNRAYYSAVPVGYPTAGTFLDWIAGMNCQNGTDDPNSAQTIVSIGLDPNPNKPDSNIWKVDGFDYNISLPAFSYGKDSPLTITFWGKDPLQKDLNANFWYGSSQGARTTIIFKDQNMSLNNGFCDSNNSKTGIVCNYNWDISGISDGNYFLTLLVNDTNDTNSWAASKSFMIDNTAPATSFSGCNNQWNNSNQTITLTCNDATGSGCRNTRYRIDGGAWAIYSAPFVLSTDLNHQIDYNSDDIKDNQETAKTSFCAVDKTPPTSNSISVTSFTGIGRYTYSNPAPFTTFSTDALSGISQMKFSCDNLTYSSLEAYATSKNNFNLKTGEGCLNSDGNKTVYVIYRDIAGNESSSVNTGTGLNSFVLDTIAPVLSNPLPASDLFTADSTPDLNVAFSETNIYFCQTRPFKNSAALADVNSTISGGRCLFTSPLLTGGQKILAMFTAFDNAMNFSSDLNTNEYTYDKIDANIWKIENNDLNSAANHYYSYYRDKNLAITFWSSDLAQMDKNASLWYGSTQGAKTNLLFFDLNLSTNYCDSNGVQQFCSWDWNISGLADGNYWLTLEIRAADVNTIPSSRSIYIDNTVPTTSWDGNTVWQRFDANIHLACQDSGSECNKIYFRKDQNANPDTNFTDWGLFDQNILFNQDGNYILDFNSIDRAGNYSDLNTQIVLIDENVPIIDNNYMSVATGSESQPNTTIVIYADVNDIYSGLSGLPTFNIQKPDGLDYNYTMAVLDGNHYKFEYGGTNLAGTYRVRFFYANDIAGNTNVFATNMYFTISGSTGNPTGGGVTGGGGGGGGAIVIEKTALDLNFAATNCGPNCVDNLFIYLPFDKTEKRDEYFLKPTVPVKSCEVGRLQQNFSCIIDSNMQVRVVFTYSDDSKFTDVLKTEITVSSFQEKTVFIQFTRRVINIGFYVKLPFAIGISGAPFLNQGLFFKVENKSIIGLRVWWIAVIISIFIALAFYYARKKT